MKNSVIFSRLMEEYGSLKQEKEKDKFHGGNAEENNNINNDKAEDELMQVEERSTGAVTWGVYSRYLRFAGGLFWVPLILILLTLMQGAQGKLIILEAYFLVILIVPSYSWE